MINPKYQFELFDKLPQTEVEWAIAHSHEETIDIGDCFFVENQSVDKFYIVLEGELQITRTIQGKELVMGTTPRGIIGGEMAILEGTASQVTACALLPTQLMVFDVDNFRQIFAQCPMLGTRIFAIATQRTQGVAQYTVQQEKMAALGKLAAGLAHELNNPAAAATRTAQALQETLTALHKQVLQLSSLHLQPDQLGQMLTCLRKNSPQALSSLEQADREDELTDWLDEQAVDEAWEIAPTLVTAGMTVEYLQTLADVLPAESLSLVIEWLHSSLNATDLVNQIVQSTHRISELVKAIKAYTYMDRGDLQEVDLHQGLNNTLAVLNHKLGSIDVLRQYDPDLPVIMGRGGELNQVWTNIIDNAIDALNGSGQIQLITRCEQGFVMVEVKDNGPGIPEAVRPHIFDPFFTTKDVGAGTGLGLDISYRIIKEHGGTIEVWSEPGETRFIVRLPT